MGLFNDSPGDISNKTRSSNMTSGWSASSDKKRKTWGENASAVLSSISNALIPGSGTLLSATGVGGLIGEAAYDLSESAGTTQEQIDRSRDRLANRNRNKDDRSYAPTAATQAADAVVAEEIIAEDIAVADTASTVAKNTRKKVKRGTDTVLTSPLGAISSASVGVTKLGGK